MRRRGRWLPLPVLTWTLHDIAINKRVYISHTFWVNPCVKRSTNPARVNPSWARTALHTRINPKCMTYVDKCVYNKCVRHALLVSVLFLAYLHAATSAVAPPMPAVGMRTRAWYYASHTNCECMTYIDKCRLPHKASRYIQGSSPQAPKATFGSVPCACVLVSPLCMNRLCIC